MRLEHTLSQPEFTAEKIAVLQVSREKGYTHSYRNGRTKHGFIYVVRGTMVFSMLPKKGEIMTATADQLVFIPKGCTYTGTYLEENTQIRIVQFDLSAGTLPPYLQAPGLLRVPNARDLIAAFFRPRDSHTFGYPLYCLSYFYALLWQIDEACNKIPSRYKKLHLALSALASHCEQNHPIGYYADLCGMSEPNFRRLFRAYTGQTPVDYRNALRLDSARAKLQSGEYNVSEAAEASGFSNLSYFIRLYKKKFGCCPKQE